MSDNQQRQTIILQWRQRIQTAMEQRGLFPFVLIDAIGNFGGVSNTQCLSFKTALRGLEFSIYVGPMLSAEKDAIWCGFYAEDGAITPFRDMEMFLPKPNFLWDHYEGISSDVVYSRMTTIPKSLLYSLTHESSGGIEWIGYYKAEDDKGYLDKVIELIDQTQYGWTSFDEVSKETDVNELRINAYNSASSQPQAISSGVERSYYLRSAAVRAYVLARAEGKCESCGCDAPFFRENGSPYLESHHIQKLSDGGLDSPEMMAALCPTCHRRVHSGRDGRSIDNVLASEISNKERRMSL